VDVRVLAASMAELAGEFGTAVEALGFVGVAVIAFAGLGFECPPDDPAGYRVAQCFKFTDHPFPRRSYIMRA